MNNNNINKWLRIDNLIAAVISIIIGVLFMLLPESFAYLLCLIAGILFMIGGIVGLIMFFANKSSLGTISLGVGITFFILGLFGVTHIQLIKGAIAMFFGAFMIAISAAFLAKSISDLRNRISKNFLPLILSILGLGLGCVVLFCKFSSIMVFTGIALVLVGIFNIIMVIVFNAQSKKPGASNGPIDGSWKEV